MVKVIFEDIPLTDMGSWVHFSDSIAGLPLAPGVPVILERSQREDQKRQGSLMVKKHKGFVLQ